jgi:hypothetical protein
MGDFRQLRAACTADCPTFLVESPSFHPFSDTDQMIFPAHAHTFIMRHPRPAHADLHQSNIITIFTTYAMHPHLILTSHLFLSWLITK